MSLFTGCAAYSDAQLTQLSRSGVSHSTLTRMEHGYPLGPDDIVELSRRNVPPGLIIRHLDRHGFDGLLTRSEAAQLRRSGVHPAVVDAAVDASDEFARDHGPSRVRVGWGIGLGWPGYYY